MAKKPAPVATERTQRLDDIAQILRRLANRLTGPLPLLRGNGLLRLGDRTIPEACATPLDRVKAREHWIKNDAGQLLVRAFALNTLADVAADSEVQKAIKQPTKDTGEVYDATRSVLVKRGTLIASDSVADTLNEFATMIEADSAEIPKLPRRPVPKDQTTCDLISAYQSGIAAGKKIEQINREFSKKHKLDRSTFDAAKRSARNYRHLWPTS